MHPTRPLNLPPLFSELLLLLLFASAVTSLLACSTNKKQPQVVFYVSVDQVYAEPVLKEIKVLTVYDVEAAKITGLVNRLLAEANYPQTNTDWSGEFAQRAGPN